MIMKKSITKKIMLGVCLMIFGFFANAQNGLEKIIVEKYYVSNADDAAASIGTLPVGSVTYRIYVDMLPGYTFQTAYGSASHPLKIATTTSFFNNEDRGATTPTYTKAQAKNNTVMLDSWVTVGAACVGNFGVLKTNDNGVATVVNSDGVLQNNDTTAGIPLTVQDGLLAGSPHSTVTVLGLDLSSIDATSQAGNLITTNSGGWACMDGVQGSTPGAKGPDSLKNILLIAQITTDGQLSFELNIQLGTPTGGTVQFVAKNPTGKEIQIPSLTYPQAKVHTPPTVSITSPANKSTYKTVDVVAITANAASSDGTISSVEFFVNGTSIGTSTSAPYKMNWTSIKGTAIITAKAKDNLDSVKISVPDTISVVDHIPPTVSITSPANNTSFKTGDVVAISANAASSDGTISSVEFFVNGSSIGTSTSAPYKMNWTSVKGTAILTAKAKDNLDSATTSAPDTIIVLDHVLPTISITSPANNAAFKTGDTVAISANAASSDGSISSVEFFVNGTSIGIDSTAPYSINWTSVKGTAILTAKAKDNLDSVTTSAPITITVSDHVGIKDIISSNNFIIYPNPFKDMITLKYNTSYQSNANSYKIYDIAGKMLLYKKLGAISGKYIENINMSSFANGQYFIELSIDGITSTRKLIKIN